MQIQLSRKYTFAKEIFREGGFFEVHKGLANDRRLVAKILKTDLGAYASGCEQGFSRQRLLNSSRLFPRIEDLGRCKKLKRLVVVEEFLKGSTLEAMIGGLVRNSARRDHIFKQIAYALYVLHSQDLIHRDNHSGNILITRKDRVVLLDFNTATTQGHHQGTAGSPAARVWGPFKDPSAADHTDFTKKSDIYALGMVFAEQLTGKKAASLAEVPFKHPEKVVERIARELKVVGCSDYLTELVVAMIAPQPSQRPDAAAILQTLELNRFGTQGKKVFSHSSRDRSFGFVRVENGRLELFIRKRDMELLNLPPRAEVKLMVLTPGEADELPRMIVAPQRFIRSDTVIMFAQASLPNMPGIFDEFILRVEAPGSYRVLGFRATRGFRHQPDTSVNLTIGQGKKAAADIASYLDPLARHLRSCIFVSPKDYMTESGYLDAWNLWEANNNYETAVSVSATLTQAYHGRFVRRREAMGYVGSTEYADTSNERYAVIRGLEIVSLVPTYFAGLQDGRFHLATVVPDGEHRDLVVNLFRDDNYALIRLHTRCLLPTDQSPRFIGKFMTELRRLLKNNKDAHLWNIESFEMKDGWIWQIAEPRYSVRVSVHIGRDISRSTSSLEKERSDIVKGIREVFQKMNGRSIEVFASVLHGKDAYHGPEELLRFAT